MANTTGKKYGGRQKGTPNRLIKELRESLALIMKSEIELLPQHLKNLEIKDRLSLLVRLLPYLMPKAELEELNSNEPLEPIIFKIIDEENLENLY